MQVYVNNQRFVLCSSSECDDAHAILHPNQQALNTVRRLIFSSVDSRRIGPLVVSDLPSGPDVIWTWYSDLLMYDHVKRTVERKISGCGFLPVALSGAAALRLENLWELRVTGFAGFASPTAEITTRSRCDECGIYSYFIHSRLSDIVDMSKWDGSDIFTIWPFPNVRICTDDAAKFFQRNDIDGLAVIPIEEFELFGGSAAPGLPSAWLTEDAIQRLMNDRDYMDAIWPL